MRAILTGEGQIDLFSSVRKLLDYIEWWWVEEFEAHVYTEDWVQYDIIIKYPPNWSPNKPDPPIDLVVSKSGESAKYDLYQYYLERHRNGWCKDVVKSPESFFDDWHDQCGLNS